MGIRQNIGTKSALLPFFSHRVVYHQTMADTTPSLWKKLDMWPCCHHSFALKFFFKTFFFHLIAFLTALFIGFD